ncbi:polysaccharide pyruvyl transferase family protein [Cryobacterium sp. PAMC25264]|nr:polysaccharide pyruvyl transferase family protein [Cryobacterium sp. PAMC25264]
MKNFGDEFSPMALEYATGRRVEWAPLGSADVVAIGSVLDLAIEAQSDALYWGTGARGPLNGVSLSSFDTSRVLAVRGPLTADAIGHPDSTLGDPGLLISEFIAKADRRKKLNHRVFVPHFRTWASAAGRQEIRIARSSGYSIVEPTRSPIAVARQIASAQFVASSSLHGLVFAHSLGTPVQMVLPTGGEDPFKYRDYFSSMELPFDPITIDSLVLPSTVSQRFAALERDAKVAATNAAALSEGLLRAASRA